MDDQSTNRLLSQIQELEKQNMHHAMRARQEMERHQNTINELSKKTEEYESEKRKNEQQQVVLERLDLDLKNAEAQKSLYEQTNLDLKKNLHMVENGYKEEVNKWKNKAQAMGDKMEELSKKLMEYHRYYQGFEKKSNVIHTAS